MSADKPLILCVDDDPDLLESTRLLLEEAGFAVVLAGSAMDGLSAYHLCKPDLVLVDLMMEEVDAGAGFVREIRGRGGREPILLVSSVGEGLHRSVDWRELGLSGVLQKPVDPDVLVRTIRAKLALQAAERASRA